MQKMILEKFLVKVKILRQENNSFIGKNGVNMSDISIDKAIEKFELIDFM